MTDRTHAEQRDLLVVHADGADARPAPERDDDPVGCAYREITGNRALGSDGGSLRSGWQAM
jgi:hypothetical protein